jgi:hypothetical protein
MILPLGKRQKQPSIDQFLPSGTPGDGTHARELPPPQHDLAGVWLPARASKRTSSKVTATIASSTSSNRTCHADQECEMISSPLDEQPQHSQPAEDRFSMTLSLGSNTEDEWFSDQQPEQQSQGFIGPQPGHQHDHDGPFQPTHVTKHAPERLQSVNAFSEPQIAAPEIFCSRLAPDGLSPNSGSSFLESTSSATAKLASPVSSSPPSNGCASPLNSSISSTFASSDVSRKAPSCSHHIPANYACRSECSQSQISAVAAAPLFAPREIVLGTQLCIPLLLLSFLTPFLTPPSDSIVVPGTLRDTADFQPSLEHPQMTTRSPAVHIFHKQLKVTAETLLPEDSMSSSRKFY